MASPLPTKKCGRAAGLSSGATCLAQGLGQSEVLLAAVSGEHPDRVDRDIEAAIVDLLRQRGRSATICPSEAAQQVGGEEWRPLMERTRRAGRRLADLGVMAVMQGGQVVDATAARGPIGYRLLT